MFISHLIFESTPHSSLAPLALIPLTVCCSESYISGEYVLASVLMALGLSLGVYGGFVMDTIFTMCDYLDINCLTVKRKTIDLAAQDGKLKN